MTTQSSPPKHTPGPWITDTGQVPKLGRSLGVLKKSHKPGEKGESICIVALAKDAQPHDHANARLIAAAPDMVSALIKMHEAGKEGGVNESDWYMCLLSETITKALGSDWHNAKSAGTDASEKTL
jgi:hypothetical protein